jgi:ribokinase
MDLVVIGSSNIDMIVYVPRIPKVGETILGEKSSMVFGGKGANQAVTAVRVGGDVCFISKVGRFTFGKNMKKNFEEEGLPVEYILTDEKESSGTAHILVSDKGENSIAVAPGANMNLSPDDIASFKSTIIRSRVILVQLEIPMETVEYIASLAYQFNIKLILNPAPAQKLSADLLRKLWLLTPNESEAELLTGIKIDNIESAKRAGQALLNMNVENVIMTLGSMGVLLCNKEGIVHYDAFHEKAIDSTGAGDVFNGSLAVAISKYKSFEEAIRFGNAAAAISVTRKGAQPSIPKLDEVNSYLKKHA